MRYSAEPAVLRKASSWWVAVIVMGFLSSGQLRAQGLYGSLVGTVVDESQAVIPGVMVAMASLKLLRHGATIVENIDERVVRFALRLPF